jgi:two-component sensor histidine kinase
MILTELVTNAAKYGALSSVAGRVRFTWSSNAHRRLNLDWREAGGIRIDPPRHQGYGTQFIERAITRELGGTLSVIYAPEGLECHMEILLQS